MGLGFPQKLMLQLSTKVSVHYFTILFFFIYSNIYSKSKIPICCLGKWENKIDMFLFVWMLLIYQIHWSFRWVFKVNGYHGVSNFCSCPSARLVHRGDIGGFKTQPLFCFQLTGLRKLWRQKVKSLNSQKWFGTKHSKCPIRNTQGVFFF